MKFLRLIGTILFLTGLAPLFYLLFEEVLYNLNYYYNHQANFVLLLVGGVLSSAIGFVILWGEEPEPEKQPSSKISNGALSV